MNKEYKLKHIYKPMVFLVCLMPLGWILARGAIGDLGPNGVETVNRFLGDWALRFLLLALAISPMAGLTKWTLVMRFRRMIGLFAYFYVVLHLGNYLVFDQFFDWHEIWADIVKRNFITIGMLSALILTPLAATSTNGMIKRLGGRNWKRLHKLVYLAGIGGVVHFYMMVKADHREPLIYGAILIFLLGYRVITRRKGPARSLQNQHKTT